MVINYVIIGAMKQFRTWLEDAWWSWGNCINFRFVNYNDNIDRLAFFEELNVGWYQEYIYPYDDWYNPTISKERKLRLDEGIPTIYVTEEQYDALMDAINNPPKLSQGLIDLMNRKTPWETEND